MLDKICIISNELEVRATALLKHISELTTKPDWKYDASLEFLTRDLYLRILELNHADFLKLNAFVKFKIGVLINLYLSEHYDPETDWLSEGNLITFINNYHNRTRDDNTGEITSGINQRHRYGFMDVSKLYNSAFYNWYAANALNENILLYIRSQFIPTLTWQAVSLRAFSNRVNKNVDSFTVQLTETNETIVLNADKFYIVTDSTKDCKILKLERFNSDIHDSFPLGNNLNGLIIKCNLFSDELKIFYLSNGLHSTIFNFDISLLGLKNVRD